MSSIGSNYFSQVPAPEALEVVSCVLSPIGYEITDKIFRDCIPRSRDQKDLKDQVFRQISTALSYAVLDASHDVEEKGVAGSKLHMQASESIQKIVCSILPKRGEAEARLKVEKTLAKACFPSYAEVQLMIKEKDKVSGMLFPKCILELFPMEKEIVYRLGALFQENLSEEGRELLEDDWSGGSFTIDHIAKEKREDFLKNLFSICLECMNQSTLEETPTEAEQKDIRKGVESFIKQFRAGVPVLELIEKTRKSGQRELDEQMYLAAKEFLPDAEAKTLVTQKRLKRKAERNRNLRMEQDLIKAVVAWTECFDGKTEEELQAIGKGTAKLPHEKAEAELLAMLELEEKQAARPSKKKGKKRKPQEGVPQTGTSETQKVEEPRSKSHKGVAVSQKPSPLSNEERLPLGELTLLNQRANDHTLLERRVARWGELSLSEIKTIPGYEMVKSEKEALEIQAKHHLKGVHALLQSEKLRRVYTFPSYYKDKKGRELSGRGILATLHYKGTAQCGVVYIGRDEASGKIYHAFLEDQPKEGRSSLDKLLRPKVYQHFRKAKEEVQIEAKKGGDWKFVSNTTFEAVEGDKTGLKMVQADGSGKEILHYVFHPIR